MEVSGEGCELREMRTNLIRPIAMNMLFITSYIMLRL